MKIKMEKEINLFNSKYGYRIQISYDRYNFKKRSLSVAHYRFKYNRCHHLSIRWGTHFITMTIFYL